MRRTQVYFLNLNKHIRRANNTTGRSVLQTSNKLILRASEQRLLVIRNHSHSLGPICQHACAICQHSFNDYFVLIIRTQSVTHFVPSASTPVPSASCLPTSGTAVSCSVASATAQSQARKQGLTHKHRYRHRCTFPNTHTTEHLLHVGDTKIAIHSLAYLLPQNDAWVACTLM